MTTSEFHANPDNFCYRHPGRQSFVLCQRCMRTVCPECQTQAAVGVICPECMQQQRRDQTPAQRRANRRWGARSMTAVGGRPIVTYWIIAITSAVSLLQMIPGIGGFLTSNLQFAGAYLYPSLSGLPFEPWRMLTALLVHGGRQGRGEQRRALRPHVRLSRLDLRSRRAAHPPRAGAWHCPR